MLTADRRLVNITGDLKILTMIFQKPFNIL